MATRLRYEFRFFRSADAWLPPGIGTTVGGVRRLTVDADDQLVSQLRDLDRQSRAKRAGGIVSSWSVRRRYTDTELDAAELLFLRVHATIEPCGEQCGTEFDESTACPRCGAGRTQVGPLILDLRGRARDWDVHTRPSPSGKDISRTIAGEIVISDRLADLLGENSITGYALGPIRQYRRPAVRPDWHQLLVTSRPVGITPPTVVGISPLDLDEAGADVCPQGHTFGLNIISELSIRRADWDGADIVRTSQAIGHRLGYLVPEHSILVSNGVGRLIREHRIRGARLEVVHLT